MSKKKVKQRQSLGVKGLGTIYYEASRDRYRGRIQIGEDENGKIKYKNVFGKTRDEVIEKLTDIKYQIMSGVIFITKSHVTIGSLGKEINQEDFDLGVMGESTFFRRNETLKMMNSLLDIEIQKVTTQQLSDFFKSKINYSQSSINKLCQLLERIFKEAIKRQIIVNNPMDQFKKPNSKKKKQKIRAMTLEEETNFLLALKETNCIHKEQMLISMFTGMRMGEVNALEVKDVDFKNSVIRVRKTITRDKTGRTAISDSTKTDAGHRTIPMMPDAAKILAQCIGNKKEGLIFLSTKGNPIATETVTTLYRNLIKEYNIQNPILDGKLNLHSLRHTFATRCIESGMPPKVLQKILGHTDITVTMNTYCDAFDSYTNEHFDIAQQYMHNNGITY